MRVEHFTRGDSTPQCPSQRDDDATTSSSQSDDDMTLASSPTAETHRYTEFSQLRTPEELDLDFGLENDELLRPQSRARYHGPKVWQVKNSSMKLSALEATVTIKRGLFTFEDLEP
jgi:hypothetical protein